MTLRGNLDTPEAALDALLQSVVCIEVGRSYSGINRDFSIIPQNVGWRDGSLRIVLILTDAGFKTALDGKVLIYPVVQSMVTLCTRWLDC